jgi:hypothetical protein
MIMKSLPGHDDLPLNFSVGHIGLRPHVGLMKFPQISGAAGHRGPPRAMRLFQFNYHHMMQL